MRKETVAIIPAAIGLGGPSPQAAEGPETLLQAGLIKRLQGLGLQVTECPIINEQASVPGSADKGCNNFSELKPTLEALYAAVSHSLKEGQLPVVLGGDHSLSIGSTKAAVDFQRETKGPQSTTGLLWVDAHADINTPQSSPSGNVHGMSVAALLGHGHPELIHLHGSKNFLTPESIVYIGLRDLDQPEREFIRDKKILNFTMKDVDLLGIGEVCNRAIAHLNQFDSVVASFDIDVIDPRYAPAVATPVRGGFTFRESHLVLELVSELDNLSLIEVVEFNPSLDQSDTTLNVALDLIESALGKSIL